MRHIVKALSLSLIIILFSFFLVTPVLALPPFPSSFYGTVKVNGVNVPDGTVIQALVDGQVYAESHTQTYEGDSFFSLDVMGDDTDTTAIDGGREGDTIQFKIGGVLVEQTAIWHGGTNVALNLTITSSKPLRKPEAIPTSVPTQTKIVLLIQPSPTLTLTPTTSARSALPNILAATSSIATKPAQSSHIVTTDMQASSPQTSPESDTANHAGNTSPATVVVIALPILAVIGYSFWTLYRKKM